MKPGILYLIEETLREDDEEAILHGDVCVNRAAIEKCKCLASLVAFRLTLFSELKWEAFGEGTGGVSFVIRSLITDRRVDFRISVDGRHVSVFSVDENAKVKSTPLLSDNCGHLYRSVDWVMGLGV